MKPVILFDLDGTLIDSTEAILEGFHVAFNAFGAMAPADEAIKQEIGHPLEDMFLTLGVVPEQVDAYVRTYKKHYRKISCAKTVLLNEAREAIIEASQFAALGIVTTKTGEYSTILLEHMGLMSYFSVLVGREHVHHPKPHPEPIFKALAKIPHENGRVWMIGDTPMDILSAQRAGVHAVAVTSGYASREILQKYASKIYSSAREAVEFIKKYDEKYK